MSDFEINADPDSSTVTVTFEKSQNGVCPECKTSAPSKGELISVLAWKQQIANAKARLGEDATDGHALDYVLRLHGGYIAECPKCATSYLVRI